MTLSPASSAFSASFAPLALLASYLLGSLPFGLWISRLVAGVDIREGGSGHVTTTNTMRHAGWGAAALVLLLDMAKGFAPTYLAVKQGLPAWGIALTAALAVVGHCWPVWAKFRGGMGLATTGGTFLAVNPLGMVVGLGVLVSLVLLYGHSARGSAVTGLTIPPVLWLLGLRGPILWAAVAAGWVLAIRFFTEDWHREYKELWLDRGESDE